MEMLDRESSFLASLGRAVRSWFFYVAVGMLLVMLGGSLPDGLLGKAVKLLGALVLAGGSIGGLFARAREQKDRAEAKDLNRERPR